MKGKIFWMSDSGLMNTGYATITRNVLNGLTKRGWDCHQSAHNYIGQPIPPPIILDDGTKIDFKIWGRGREDYCKDILEPRLQALRPDIFVTLLDTFMLYPWIIDKNFSPAKSVFYFPSDGTGGLPQDCDRVLKHYDCAVAMSKFGQRQAKEVHGMDVEYIPHAVHTDVFRPLSKTEKESLRAEFEVNSLTGARVKGFLKNKFVVGVVARNQGRKMLDLTIKSFAPFAKKNPDAVLYFHSDLFDAAAVFDMRHLVNRYGLQNRVCWSPIKYYENFDYKDMNKVYNVMDLFFLSTSGEGFGIPTIEAMACEVPVLVADNTTGPELVIEGGEAGMLVKQIAEITGSWAVERGIIDISHATLCLQTLYSDPELRKEYGRVGREKVLREYDWDKVNNQWDKLFERLIV